MAERLRAHNWTSSPLGPPDHWPSSLRTTVELMLGSDFPMFLAWGDDLVMLYNDGYVPMLADKHPAALGARFQDVWSEIWADISPMIEAALDGHSTYFENLPFTMNRKGYDEETWFTFSYSPARGDDGEVAGMFCACTETTDGVRAERRTAAEVKRQAALIALDDTIADMADPVDIAFTSARILGQAMNACRVGYGEIDPDAETIVIDRDWHAPDMATVAGLHRFRDYGTYVDTLLAGQPAEITDVETDPRTANNVDALKAFGIRALLDVPLTEQGRVVAQIFVHSDAPRVWTADEITFARAFAERTRAAVARRRAERDRVESEARFRNMADNTPMMMWVTDPKGYCTYLNQTWYEFTGQSVGEAEGYGWLDATHPDDKARAEEAFVTANAAQAPFRVEYRLRRADGTYRWAIDAASPRFTADGEYLGYVGSVIDIGERREMEEALRESEAQFRAFAQAVPNHVWASHPDGHLYWFNQQVYAYAGVSPGEIDGPEGWAAIVHPDDLPAAAAAWGRALESGQFYETEFRIRRADGAWRRFVVRAEPVLDEEGRILRWVGANIDVEDIRVQGQELEQVNQTLSELLAGSRAEREQLWALSQDMLARGDYAGGLSAVNPAWTQSLGWSEQELLTNPYADIIHPDNVLDTIAALEAMGRTGQPTRYENRILSKSGEWTPIGWTVSPEPDGVNFIAVGRDLTEDKAREQELAKAQEALRQSQKMEAVGQLTGGIAHDFNNLLAGISGSLELLEKRLGEGRLAGIERYITAAQGASKRAAALTQRLLAFSRRQTLDPRPTDVNRLIAGMEDLVRRSVGPNVEVEVVGASGLWPTMVDQSQLENALLNLCINSRDAMAPDGGRLTIETANTWLDDRAAKAQDLPPGQYVSLCVTDTGTGMPPEIAAQAFDPFFTTKPLGQGTGLGLSMIHGFVRQSGGQVRIYTEPGQGTTMCLYLPRYMGQVDGPEVSEVDREAPAGHGETVLVIDDEATVRMLVVEVLHEAGYHAIEAPDGPSGLAILQSDVRIDLLITDVGLPGGMNGRQVADAARVKRPELKILFITGYAENAAVGNGMLEPGMEVLTKPFAMSALATKIREIVES